MLNQTTFSALKDSYSALAVVEAETLQSANRYSKDQQSPADEVCYPWGGGPELYKNGSLASQERQASL